MLALDTCELLRPDIDQILRNFIVGLLSETTQMLVIIGSRLPPDAGLPQGARNGWLTEIEPGKRRIISFGEDFRFSPSEISQLLDRTANSIQRTDALPRNIYHVTLGIPLLVRVLLDLHDNGDGILEELSGLPRPDSDTEYSRARQIVCEAITERWLLHIEKGSPEDLQTIVALGLLRKAIHKILQLLWQPASPDGRIRQLRRRYSLLDSGDLHETVRIFLRRRWRKDPHPAVRSVAEKLEVVINRLEPEQKADSQYFAWLIERLNMRSWLQHAECAIEFARSFAVALAYDFDLEEFAELAHELADIHPDLADLSRSSLSSRFYLPFYSTFRLVPWLEAHWSIAQSTAHEQACFDILCALRMHEVGEMKGIKDSKHWSKTCSLFEKSLEYFGQDPPRRLQVTKSYLLSAFHATLDSSGSDVAERAYRWATTQPNAQEEYWVSVGISCITSADTKKLRKLIGRHGMRTRMAKNILTWRAVGPMCSVIT